MKLALNRRLVSLSLCVGALLLPTTAALADVDVEIRNGDSVVGTLDANETITLRVRVPAGSLLSVVAQGKKTKGAKKTPVPAPRVQVFGGGPDDLASGRTKDGKRSAKLKKLPLDTTREYRIVLTSDSGVAGAYQAKVSWKPAKKINRSIDTSGDPVFVNVPAGRGDALKLSVKASRKSPSVPRLSSLKAGEFELLFDPPARASATKHTVKDVLVPRTADYQLTLIETGASGGPATVSVKIRAAKFKKAKVDLTADQLGGGSQTALGIVIGPEGGSITIAPEVNPLLGGAGLSVPAGALPSATPLIVGSAPPITNSPDNQGGGVGPTVFFGPSGQQFSSDVTVTIPFDPTNFGGDFSSLRVVERDGNGELSIVDPNTYVIDGDAGTVSYPASHFTSYRAFGPVRPAQGDLNADGIPDIVLFAPQDNGRVKVFFGRESFMTRSEGTADVVISGTATETLLSSYTLGDVSGDGIADLVVGTIESGSTYRARIFLGRSGFPSAPALTDADISLVGPVTREEFGSRLLVTNFDGPLLVVGAPFGGPGSVYVFRGGAGFTSTSQALAILTGPTSGGAFGTSLAVGDINDNVEPEVFVGDPDHGSVFVFEFDGEKFTHTLADEPTLVFTGERSGDSFGAQIAARELTGDGVDDLLVADPLFDFVNSDEGRDYLFAGSTEIGDTSAANADAEIRGVIDGQLLGFQTAVGDLNGDGEGDFVLSEPTRGSPTELAGRVSIFLGKGAVFAGTSTNQADIRIDGEVEDDLFGAYVEIRDVTGDGIDDLLVGAPRHTAGAEDSGTVYVFRGGAGFAPVTPADALFEIEGNVRQGFFSSIDAID